MNLIAAYNVKDGQNVILVVDMTDYEVDPTRNLLECNIGS